MCSFLILPLQRLQNPIMTALACIVSRTFSLVAAQILFRPCFQQNLDQLDQTTSRCLVQRAVATGLRHVYVRSLCNEDADRLRIPAQGNTCMQCLIVQWVAREAVHVRSVGKQQNCCRRSAKCGCQVERSPTVSRARMDQHGVLS